MTKIEHCLLDNVPFLYVDNSLCLKGKEINTCLLIDIFGACFQLYRILNESDLLTTWRSALLFLDSSFRKECSIYNVIQAVFKVKINMCMFYWN
jgi:hypothetical protein